jgi:hypothetical protein
MPWFWLCLSSDGSMNINLFNEVLNLENNFCKNMILVIYVGNSVNRFVLDFMLGVVDLIRNSRSF